MDIHRAHNHPSINSAAPGTRIEISIREASCSQSVQLEISAAKRAEIGQPEVVDTLHAFPAVPLLSLRRSRASQFRPRNYAPKKNALVRLRFARDRRIVARFNRISRRPRRESRQRARESSRDIYTTNSALFVSESR